MCLLTMICDALSQALLQHARALSEVSRVFTLCTEVNVRILVSNDALEKYRFIRQVRNHWL